MSAFSAFGSHWPPAFSQGRHRRVAFSSTFLPPVRSDEHLPAVDSKARPPVNGHAGRRPAQAARPLQTARPVRTSRKEERNHAQPSPLLRVLCFQAKAGSRNATAGSVLSIRSVQGLIETHSDKGRRANEENSLASVDLVLPPRSSFLLSPFPHLSPLSLARMCAGGRTASTTWQRFCSRLLRATPRSPSAPLTLKSPPSGAPWPLRSAMGKPGWAAVVCTVEQQSRGDVKLKQQRQ